MAAALLVPSTIAAIPSIDAGGRGPSPPRARSSRSTAVRVRASEAKVESIDRCRMRDADGNRRKASNDEAKRDELSGIVDGTQGRRRPRSDAHFSSPTSHALHSADARQSAASRPAAEASGRGRNAAGRAAGIHAGNERRLRRPMPPVLEAEIVVEGPRERCARPSTRRSIPTASRGCCGAPTAAPPPSCCERRQQQAEGHEPHHQETLMPAGGKRPSAGRPEGRQGLEASPQDRAGPRRARENAAAVFPGVMWDTERTEGAARLGSLTSGAVLSPAARRQSTRP